ncbi:MAG: Wzz/FepE/Etk N-terminal domain-containing protein [Acidobacteriota bacterium]
MAKETFLIESTSRLALRDLLTVVFKRRAVIGTFTAGVLALVAGVTFFSAPTYEVSASLLMNKARADIPLAPKESPRLTMDQVSQQELNSELEILRSRQVIEQALETLGVDESWRSEGGLGAAARSLKQALGAPRLSAFDEMVVRLQSKLDIANVRRSNVIRVRLRSKDPERATRLVQSLIESYIDRRADMYQSPQAVSFFEQQMVASEALLSQSEKSLEHYLDGAGITMIKESQGSDALEAQKALGLERLARIQGQLADTQAEILERRRKKARLEASLAEEPERLRSSSRLHHSAVIEEIEKALATLELERDGLLQDFEPGNRYVRDIESQIRLTQERLAKARTEVRGIDRTEINPVYLELKAEWLRVEADLAGSQGRLASLRGHLAECRKELEALNNAAFEMESLRRNVQVAEEGYLLYRRKHEEARIESAMDRQKLINVTIAQPAQRPLEPVAPRKAMNLLFGLVLGLVGGLGLAFAAETYFDRTFTTGRAIERRLGIQHVVSIPEQTLAPAGQAPPHRAARDASGRRVLRWSALALLVTLAGAGLLLSPATVESAGAGTVRADTVHRTLESAGRNPTPDLAGSLSTSSQPQDDPAAAAQAVEAVVESWAAAWSAQQPQDYLSFYSPSFDPQGAGRQAWERQRKARILAPASLLVQVSNLAVELIAQERAEATFHQSYQTDAIRLYTWKTLELQRLPKGWVIAGERLRDGPPDEL